MFKECDRFNKTCSVCKKMFAYKEMKRKEKPSGSGQKEF